jgi:hypothetical protein
MGHHCCKAINEKAIRPRPSHGERAYAAVTDQLPCVRGRPGRLRGVGVFGTAVVLDLLPSRPRPICFASPDRLSE